MGDAFAHLARKWVAERTRQASIQRAPSPSAPPPPPPYNQAVEQDEEAEADDSDFDSEDNEPTPLPTSNSYHNQHQNPPQPQNQSTKHSSSSPLKITINAANSIQGSGNLVPTSITPLTDAARFSQLLMVSIHQIQSAVQQQQQQNQRGRRGRGGGWNGTIDLTVNCGITVVGDRNVIGNVGVKPRKVPVGVDEAMAEGEGVAVVGAKRKVADDDSLGPQKPAKKVSFKEEPVVV